MSLMPHDLDDTVARPPRVRARVVELEQDLDDTLEVQRAASSATTTPAVESSASDTSAAQPPALVDPQAAPVAGNVWAAALPERPRPFRLRLSNGTVVPIDQPVYLGRRPSVPRIHPGGVPLLVTLDSPDREVSSTHLELTTVGGTVVASDMRSTNGSVLRIPGAAARTLIAGESAVVTPGTRIELGDGNVVELLAPDADAPAPGASAPIGRVAPAVGP